MGRVWGKWRGDSETCVCGGGEFEEGFYDLPANGNKSRDNSDITEKRFPLNLCPGSPSGLRPPVNPGQ